MFDRTEYNRKWVANRRYNFFKDKNCAFCGTTNKLDLDHIDPKLKIDHKIWSWSRERQETELIKCQVLCHSCHTARHRIEMSKHGIGGYHRGCRCEICKAAKVVENKTYRKPRRSCKGS